MSAPALSPIAEDEAADFATKYAEKAIEAAQAQAHAEINRVFGVVREALQRKAEKKTREGKE